MLTALGLLACAFYVIHAAFHYGRGEPQNAVWVCHVAALLVGGGLVFRWPSVNAMGVLILLVGCPLWLLSLLGGEEFLPTSLLTHVGALVIGLIGVRRLGLPAGAWWKAGFFVASLMAVSLLLSKASNVNVVHAPYAGWEGMYPVAGLYQVQLWVQWCVGLFVAEFILQKCAPSRLLGVDQGSE